MPIDRIFGKGGVDSLDEGFLINLGRYLFALLANKAKRYLPRFIRNPSSKLSTPPLPNILSIGINLNGKRNPTKKATINLGFKDKRDIDSEEIWEATIGQGLDEALV